MKKLNNYPLTDEQEAALSYVFKMFKAGESYAQISGCAGTGKTTLAFELLDRAAKDGFTCHLTAPTNKAAKVLADKAGRPAITIHKLFRLVLEDVEDAQELRRAGGECMFEDDRVLIVVDEASMMNEELMEIVDETVAINDCVKVLFLGDPYQLNPINEEHSRALDYDGVELKTIMRQAEGNPIIQLAHEIRIAQETESSIIHWHDYVDNKRIHIYGSINQFIESYLHDFIHGVDAHIVAWRNSKVISTNDYIREQLYGVDAKIPFLVGEQVMLYTPIIREVNGKKRILMDNSEIATVLKVETTQERVANSIVDSYRLTLKSDYREKSVYAYYPVDKPEFDAALQTIVNNAKAASDSRKRAFIFSTYYYPLKNYFTELRPAHALTSHKSQGSTYQKVYVHVQDIGLNRNLIERLRSLYVACTRGSEELHLYGVGRPRSK